MVIYLFLYKIGITTNTILLQKLIELSEQMLNLDTASETEKGKNADNASDSDDEIKSFHSSSVSKAAKMAAG